MLYFRCSTWEFYSPYNTSIWSWLLGHATLRK